MATKIKVNDRVKRKAHLAGLAAANSTNGDPAQAILLSMCLGTVKAIREETSLAAKAEAREKAVMFHVLWDNGTLSYFGPEGLEVIAE